MTATRKQGARNPANLSNFSCKIHSYSGMTRAKNKNEEVPERRAATQPASTVGTAEPLVVPRCPFSLPLAHGTCATRRIFPLCILVSTNQFILPAPGSIISTYCDMGPNVHGQPAPALIIPNQPTLPSIHHAMRIYIYSQTAHLHFDASPSIAQPTLGDVD
jgi:hypothetical protein